MWLLILVPVGIMAGFWGRSVILNVLLVALSLIGQLAIGIFAIMAKSNGDAAGFEGCEKAAFRLALASIGVGCIRAIRA
ncbi:hypothetical protein AAEX63_01845 [Luteococcus sp. H138]|uniref:hypothetical protein n=1 Tax=Luteococcus sp. H138 TaxID=3139404 RepID=UPI00313E242A